MPLKQEMHTPSSARGISENVDSTIGYNIQVQGDGTTDSLVNDDIDAGTTDADMRDTTLGGEKNGTTTEESGLDVLKNGMRAMIELVTRLRALGTENLGLALPRIAVVGNQSAGKSSLIEAISGIKVPRSTGTCTRCPLEINLSESIDPTIPWKCRISVRFNKAYQPTNRVGVNPWVEKQALEQFVFCDLTSRDQVEGTLALVQAAILNPSKDWKYYQKQFYMAEKSGDFLAYTEGWKEEEKEVKFSPNVVCMEISEHGLPNLAFIDLPGVIQTTESETEDYLIELVQGLVKEYVKEKDCLILLAMTMKDDAVNQSAARLARDFGEDRIIGALTKPDTVSPAEFQQWEEILLGKAHKLCHGYFVTKQPSQDQLVAGISHADARIDEERFFETTEPWSTRLAEMKGRFGTANLQLYLAGELGKLITGNLGSIFSTLKTKAAAVEEELQNYPAPTENQLRQLENLIAQYGRDLLAKANGGPKNPGFLSKLEILAEDFRDSLRTTRPKIVYDGHERADTPGRSGRPNEYMGFEDSNSGGNQSNPRKRQREYNGSQQAEVNNLTRYTLSQIRDIRKSTTVSRVPGEVDHRAKDPFIHNVIKSWEPLITQYLSSVNDHIKKVALESFTVFFQTCSSMPVFKAGKVYIQEYIEAECQRVGMHIRYLYDLEQGQILTFNGEEMDRHKKQALDFILKMRERKLEEEKTQRLQRLVTLPETAVRKQQIKERIEEEYRNPDPFKDELAIMADVRAYNELAQRRFFDYCQMTIHRELVFNSLPDVGRYLGEKFGLQGPNAHENAQRLLVEDPEREARRLELLAQAEKLRESLAEVDRFQKAFCQ